MSMMTRVPRGWESRPCLGTSLALWYGPGDGAPVRSRESTEQKARRERLAKRVCAGCPFTEFCLADELTRPISHQWGVRGGMTAAERRRLIRDRRTAGREVAA
ncbi:MAG: WhiB family transcriptional regulator [Nocardioidaceae bacterium]